MEQFIDVKVYYEDTDCLGIVYHTNYLKYMERGRTEYFNLSGRPIWEWNGEGYNFAVFEMKIKFLKPARLGDMCRVVTSVGEGGSDYRLVMMQRVELNGQTLVEAQVDVVCMDNSGKLRAFPKGIFVKQ